MTIDVEVLRADLKAIGYDLIDTKGFKLYVTKWVNDSASYTVATIHKVYPHAWEVKDYYHHKMWPKEQEELIELLKKYATMGD